MRTVCKAKNVRNERAGSSRGIALITTLLLMSLMIAITLGMTIAVTSDTLITRYYKNFRSSFYAADSGSNIARQYLANQLIATIPATFSTTTQPIPSTAAATVQSSLLSTYGSSGSASNLVITSGAAANSWKGSFYVASSPAPTLTLTSCTPQYSGTKGPTNAGPYSCTNIPTCAGCTAAQFTLTDFLYVYNYSFTSMGQSLASEQSQVQDVGAINITVNVAPSGSTTQSFAGWGMFIDQFAICSSDLVGGTMTGPVFTNGAWTYSTTSTGYTYSDTVGSVSPNFGYDFGNTCDQKSTASDSNGGSTIAPHFNGSPQFKLGQNSVPLPQNSYNQKEAVVDGTGSSWTSSETAAQMDAAMNPVLKTYNGTAYPSAGTSNPGVYLPYTVTSTVTASCPVPTCRTMTGGGIYVEGDAKSVQLSTASPTISGSVHNEQIFTIVQGSTTTVVTEDLTGNTTTISNNGGTPTTITGLFEDDVTGTPTPATMLYVDGDIGSNSSNTGLSGPGQGLAAVQNNAQITVTAAGDIDITGDILYKTPPINIPADTVAVPSTTNSEVLGVFTANGNINLDNQQSNGNLEVDASLATISQGGSGGLTNPGNAINTLTIVGGRIQNTIQNINTTTRNVWFDRRFAQGGFAPPWFPSTTITGSATDSASGANVTFNRTSWTAPNE